MSPDCAALARVVRHWVKARSLASTIQGCLPSCAWVEMVIFFLQSEGRLPCLQKPGRPWDWDKRPPLTTQRQ
ncbi:unnamed protein product, partial [Amoebophrya sp. A25]|eukprot:GSA25T00002595001.1